MKKSIGIALLALLLLSGCTKPLNMNTVLDEPNFAGVVTEVTEKTITVRVNADEEAYKSSDLIVVSLDVELKDGLSEYAVGDEVRVYYDGSIAESYPAQVNKVYAITIVNQAHREIDFDDISSGMSREAIHELFGQPDDMLSGLFGDVYFKEDGTRVTIYYDADTAVSEVKVEDAAPCDGSALRQSKQHTGEQDV